MSNKVVHDITCTVCGRKMDYTLLGSECPWAVVPVLDGDAYACSTLCGVRLGYVVAEELASAPDIRTRDTLPEIDVARALPLN